MHCTYHITLFISIITDDTAILASQERKTIRSSSAECYAVEAGDTRGFFQHYGIRNYFRQNGECLPWHNNWFTWNVTVVVISNKSVTPRRQFHSMHSPRWTNNVTCVSESTQGTSVPVFWLANRTRYPDIAEQYAPFAGPWQTLERTLRVSYHDFLVQVSRQLCAFLLSLVQICEAFNHWSFWQYNKVLCNIIKVTNATEMNNDSPDSQWFFPRRWASWTTKN